MKEDKIDKIKVIMTMKLIKSLYELFSGCEIIEKISFINFYKDDIINMSHMFSGCSSLKKLNLSNFNTNNVTDMSDMFTNCSKLQELDLSNFITNKVTDMTICSKDAHHYTNEIFLILILIM